MENLSVRQDKPYRRGLVLGLTVAEIMILIIFSLLLALTASLSSRERRIKQLELVVASQGMASQLLADIQKRRPDASTYEDYFKELTLAFDAADLVEGVATTDDLKETVLADAAVGQRVRAAAEKANVDARTFLEALMEISADPKAAAKTLAEAKNVLASRNAAGEWPPFINLSEAGGYFFESGSAELRPEFRQALQSSTIDQLKAIIDRYGVDVVEVIGHTDEVPMPGRSTLDSRLVATIRGSAPITSLSFADNAGLGMARAVSVVRILRADARLSGVKILPLSAAQMIVPVDTLADGSQAGDTPERRRIEIRVRRSTDSATGP